MRCREESAAIQGDKGLNGSSDGGLTCTRGILSVGLSDAGEIDGAE